MAPTPIPKTTAAAQKKIDREKKKEEAQRLRRLKEQNILNKIGIKKPAPKKTLSFKIPEVFCFPIVPPVDYPSRSEQSITALLAQPTPRSPLNPVTDMSLVQLTMLKLSSELCISVLDL